MPSVIGTDFFDRPVLKVAPDLLNCRIVTQSPEGRMVVRLTEVEAYDGGSDPGSHAFRGPTERNTVMFGEPGHLYVYFTYGMHWCANVVCGPAGQASAVLLRAGEVVDGVELARLRRPAARTDRDLARGPARLCQALGIDGTCNGADIGGSRIQITPAAHRPDQLGRGPRVGLAQAAERPWRFWVDGDPTVSAYRAARPRRPR